MATLREKPEVVDEISRCQSIVSDLMKCDTISMDAEGIQLGKDGPMTLLQISTMGHQVYLFDVQENKRLFTEGKLRDLLQSSTTTKVIHSCSGDSAALYFQFNIRLQGVFDTQVANIVIEENKGTQLPAQLKLEDLCSKYSTTATVAHQKTSLKEKWLKEAENLWARRPLTTDMIEYAAGDVTALIPDLYENQRRYIEQHCLQRKLKERVEEAILLHIDEKMMEQRRQRVRQTVRSVMTKFSRSSSYSVRYPDITDDDVIIALKRINFDDATMISPTVSKLKTESLKAELAEIEVMLREDPSVAVEKKFYALRDGIRHPDSGVSQKARRLQDTVNRSQVTIIAKKYSPGTGINYLSESEKEALKRLRVSGVNDRTYPTVVLELYWKLMNSELESTFTKLRQQGRKFRMNEGYYKKIRFFMGRSSPVPQDLKTKASEFIQLVETLFGKDVIPKQE